MEDRSEFFVVDVTHKIVMKLCNSLTLNVCLCDVNSEVVYGIFSHFSCEDCA